jgi:hypothetical protein
MCQNIYKLEFLQTVMKGRVTVFNNSISVRDIFKRTLLIGQMSGQSFALSK